MKKKTILITLLILIVVVLLFLIFYRYQILGISPEGCISKGGRVSSMMTEVDGVLKNECYKNETNIGEVNEVLCPCICCVPKK